MLHISCGSDGDDVGCCYIRVSQYYTTTVCMGEVARGG